MSNDAMQDDHCLLHIQGIVWRITTMREGFVFLSCGRERCALDLRNVCWEHVRDSATWMLNLHTAAVGGRLSIPSARMQ